MSGVALATDIHVATSPEEIHAARDLVFAVNRRDLGYGYDPVWHRDLDLAYETYVTTPRQLMLVAVEGADVIACGGLRVGVPQSPPALRERYPDPSRVCQVVRVATHWQARRRGLARRIVERLVDHARQDPATDHVYLHTNARHPGAVEFWQAMGGEVVLDERGSSGDPRLATVHLQIPLRGA
ncbi:GNAT family N-acetyltransferase [Arsenicicoccus dermatophilus]|uniref:GNAT family N-acetyltransferase n=1 Tax=Arsenicicoccus dermatophilus TaxID=1076331 RepID=UPI0039171EAD